MKSLYLNGPGRAVAGSEGIRVSPTADDAAFEDIRIDNFDVGLHMVGTLTDLLNRDFFTNTRIGLTGIPTSPSVNTAVHLNGHIGNVYFTNFHLAGWRQLIVSDGPGVSGAAATFSVGTLNTTKTSGTPAVYVGTSDGVGHFLHLSDIQDWETSTPYLQVGDQAYVTIDGITFSGDPWQVPGYPAFEMLPSTSSELTINNAFMFAENDGLNLVKVGTANGVLHIANSHIQGIVTFTAAARASFVSNWCWGALAGTLTNVRASANVGLCPDR